MNAIPQKPIEADPTGDRKAKARAAAETDDVRLTIDFEDEITNAGSKDSARAETDPDSAQAWAGDAQAEGPQGDAASSGAAGQGRPAQADGSPASRSAMNDPNPRLAVPAQLAGIEVTLTVEIGSHRLPLRDLLSVDPGQLFTLDRMTSDPVSILVNGKPFAQGEVVAIGDRFGVRLVDILAPEAL